MKNFSGVCQAAGADKPLRAFFIWITNIVTLLKFCLEPLACFGNGGRGDSQQDGLLRYGELQVRENIGADIALCQIVMRFPERFGPEV